MVLLRLLVYSVLLCWLVVLVIRSSLLFLLPLALTACLILVVVFPKQVSSGLSILLSPLVWVVGELVMRDLKKWASTPYLFDTEPNCELIRAWLTKRLEALEAEGEILTRMLEIVRQLKGSV